MTGTAEDAGAGHQFTDRASPLPIRCVAISPSPNGPAAKKSLAAMLETHGYQVEARKSPIPSGAKREPGPSWCLTDERCDRIEDGNRVATWEK